jgi:hypothetical protein
MSHRLTLACVAAAMISVVASAAVPNFFVAGQPATASSVNQNFQYLDQRTNRAIGGLTTSRVSASSDLSTSVVTAACPSNSLVLSASCSCQPAGGTRNHGVLFGCSVAGNAAIVGCHNEALTYNPNLPPPRGDVTALCLGGVQVDGTPLFVTFGAKADEDTADVEAKEAEHRQAERDHAAALNHRR